MPITYLKRGKSQSDIVAGDAEVRAVGEKTLAEIESGGDTAVRAMSERFDNHSPDSFRLTQSEIEAAIQQVSTRDMEDIRFAQEQIRKFAQAQRDSMRDIEIETLPG